MKDEMTYTIPLREDFVKVPKHRRAKRAISKIKSYITRHMKTENIKIGKELNEKVWGNGIKNPPGKVTVKVKRVEDSVTVELEGFEYKSESIQTKKEEPKTLKDKLEAKMGDKPAKAEKAEKKASKKAEQTEVKPAQDKPKEAEVKTETTPEKTKEEAPKAQSN